VLETKRYSGSARNLVDADRLLVNYCNNSTWWATARTNCIANSESSEHHPSRRHSEHATTRHGMAIHFHRLSNLQQLSARA
jgi:hypothetical protein